MTTISIRPVGQEAPVITGELASEGQGYWYIRLASGTMSVPFTKEQWELVPVPFVFPTAFGARITGVNKLGMVKYFILNGYRDWQAQGGGLWAEHCITGELTDLRVVDADPDWGDE